MINDLNTLLRHPKLTRRMRRNLAEIGGDWLSPGFRAPRIAYTRSGLTPTDIRLDRRGDGLMVTVHADVLRRKWLLPFVAARTRTYIRLFAAAGAGVDRLTCDISDGERPSLAEVCFCALQDDRCLLPDHHFIIRRGYQEQRDQYRAAARPWDQRSDDIVWRGKLNGGGLSIGHPGLTGNGLVKQRLRLAYACRGTDLDVKFVVADEATEVMRAEGLMGDRVEAQSWLGRKYAIDIDGNVNAWDNFYIRLLYGCCVLKVDSQAGFRQWYYHRLEPYRHYVPIRADLSDLVDQVDWVRSHPDQARAIAANGCELAHAMTFDSELEVGAEKIRALCRARRDTGAPTA